MQPVGAPRTEHISLESDPPNAKPLQRARYHVAARLRWRNALRGIEAQFDLADDHFLLVRYLQPRRAAQQYMVDLRFCAAKPRRSRHIAWLTLGVATLLALAAGAMTFMLASQPLPESPSLFVGGTIALATAALAALGVFLHRTTESLEFTSLHGGASLACFKGGLGSGRDAKAFCIELIKSINVAQAPFDTASQAYLRDEMRDHHRLRNAGALDEKQYEACKQRILAAHAG